MQIIFYHLLKCLPSFIETICDAENPANLEVQKHTVLFGKLV